MRIPECICKSHDLPIETVKRVSFPMSMYRIYWYYTRTCTLRHHLHLLRHS